MAVQLPLYHFLESWSTLERIYPRLQLTGSSQPFWGHIVAAANAGPPPIAYKALSSDNLEDAIRFCLGEDIRASVQSIAKKMNQESGVRRAVKAFHAHLPIADLPCDILDNRPAVWKYRRKGKHFKLSGIAAEVLIDHLKVDPKKLRL